MALDREVVDMVVRERDDAPVFYFGATPATSRAPFRLTRAVIESTGFATRPCFTVSECDPVTTRMLQLWRPGQFGTKTSWLREFIKLKPGDPVLCWLTCMGAVSVLDVERALLEYGWLGEAALLPGVARELRLDHVLAVGSSARVPDLKSRMLMALREIAAVAGTLRPFEWLDIEDAEMLLSACEAREAAQKQEAAHGDARL